MIPLRRPVTRRECAWIGAAFWCGGLLLWGAIACGLALLFKRPECGRILRYFYFALGAALVLGPAAGVIRYQMKCGTEDERRGGGGCAQVLFVLPMIGITLATVAFPGALLLFAGAVLKKDFWGDGTSGYIGSSTAVAWLLLLVVVAAGKAGWSPLIWPVALIGAIGSSDHFLTWQIFAWHKRGLLADTADDALPRTFYLNQLLFAAFVLGAYLTGLFWLLELLR